MHEKRAHALTRFSDMTLFIDAALLALRNHVPISYVKSPGHLDDFPSQEVLQRVQWIAHHLAARFPKATRLILCFPPEDVLEYLETFLACLAVGMIAAPAASLNPARFDKDIQTLEAIKESSGRMHVPCTS